MSRVRVTVVFKSDYDEALNLTVEDSMPVGEIKELLSNKYSGVAYIAIGVYN